MVVLTAGRTVGQTFVARHAGLAGVEVWLEPRGEGVGALRLHLRADPAAESDLAESAIPLADVRAPGFYRLSFPPRVDAHGRYLYVFWEVDGGGAVALGTAPGDRYLDGALHQEHTPQDRQLAFRLVYDPLWIAVDLLRGLGAGLGALLAIVGLFVVPGWAVLAWAEARTATRPAILEPWPARLGVAVGLSLALYPLLFLWTALAGLRLGAGYAWGPILGGLIALAGRFVRWRPPSLRLAPGEWSARWPDLAFLLVAGLVGSVRWVAARSLEIPLWGDSYQHTLIAQRLSEAGGLFDSWEPYAPLQTLTYHFGFHAAVAVFHWATGLEIVRAVVLVGQALNALAVLVLYPLAVWLGRSRWAGVGAVLVAGLLSPLPMAYTNWGRYTQLAGLVILPAAVLATRLALAAGRRWRVVVLGWLAIGGLALTHYRVLIFYALFALAWLAVALARGERRVIVRAAVLGGGGMALAGPWVVHTFAGALPATAGRLLGRVTEREALFLREYNALGDPFAYLPPALWLALLVALAVGLWRRSLPTAVVGLWWLLLLLATNPAWLGLPGGGVITNFALFITAYLPAGVLTGALVGWLLGRWAGRRGIGPGGVAVALALGLWGAQLRLGDLDPGRYALVTRPDQRAAVWIQRNLPPEARFLVNGFFAYGESVVVGSDGGWWLPLLARRAATVPPLTYATERGPWPGYREWVNELYRVIAAKGVTDAETVALLRARGITHVYIGQRQGRVNNPGPPVLDPSRLRESPAFQLVYHADRVWIFALRPAEAPAGERRIGGGMI
jgi:hypothetical protein